MAAVPIDRGWAWMIVLGAMMVNFFMIGFFKSIGILFVEIREVFVSSAAVTALMMGIIGGSMSIMAPFGTAIGERIGHRRVVMFGGLLCASGAFFSSFAQDVLSFALTIGILMGLGYGCQLSNCMVMVGKYFVKRRALANGLAMAGGSLGCLMIPIIMRLLIDAFTFRGALLVYSALVLHQIIGGALFRPTSFYTDSTQTCQEMLEKDGISEKSNRSALMPSRMCCDCQERDRASPHDGVSVSKLSRTSDAMSVQTSSGKLVDEDSSIHESGIETKLPVSHLKVSGEDGTESLLGLSGSIMTQQCDCSCHLAESTSGNVYTTNGVVSGSREMLPSVATSSRDAKSQQDSLLSSCMASFCFCCVKMPGVKPLLDWSIFHHPLFIVYVIGLCFCNIGYVTSYNFMPPLCEENGIGKQATAILMSYGGVVDLIGRVGGGWFADFNYVKKCNLMGSTIIFSGCVSLIFPLYINIYTVYIYISILGIFGGTYISMMAVVLCDFVGFERMPNAFGLAVMFLGMTNMGMPSFFGFVRDISNYGVIYHIVGAFMVIGGLFFLSEPLARRIERRQLQKKQRQLELQQHSDPLT